MTGTGARFHRGLTPEQVIDAAMLLTRGSNLYGWSIRDLARELQVTPSTIYHHVGGKDLLAKRVAERAVEAIATPPPKLEWQDWFRELLIAQVYPAVVRHPGVAKWVLMHGVPFTSATPIFEIGIEKLRQAGFGDQAALVYSAIMNSAVLNITIGDERMLHEDDGPRDHAAMMREFQDTFVEHPLLTSLGRDFISAYASGGERAAQMREEYYRYSVDVTLAGVAAVGPPAHGLTAG